MLILRQPSYQEPSNEDLCSSFDCEEDTDSCDSVNDDVKPSLKDEPIVIHAHDTSNCSSKRDLIVLIHGLNGHRYGSKATWGRMPKYLFGDFASADIGMYEYQTLFKRWKIWRSISLQSEAEILAGILRDTSNYRRIVLVGHSMGGILALSVLKHLYETNQKEQLSRVGGVMLVATPQAGSRLVPRMLSYVSKDFRVLRSHSRYLTDLQNSLSNAFVLDESHSSSTRISVPTWAVIGCYDIWVDRLSSSLNLPTKRVKLVRASHSKVAKPKSQHSDDAYLYIKSKIGLSFNSDALNLEPGSSTLASETHLESVDSKKVNFIPSSPDIGMVNRVVLLDRVRSYLEDEPGNVYALIGEPGIGKSAIAKTLTNESALNASWARSYSAIVWTSAQHYRLSAEAVYERPVRSHSHTEVYRDILFTLDKPEATLRSVDEQVSTIQHLLGKTQVLVVIDNIEELLENSSNGPNIFNPHFAQLLLEHPYPSTFLLTSSVRLPSNPYVKPIDVGSMDRESSMIFLAKLRNHIGMHQDQDTDKKLYSVIGGVPLVLEWALGRVADVGVDRALKDLSAPKQSVSRYLFKSRWEMLVEPDKSIIVVLSLLPSSTNVFTIATILKIDPDHTVERISKLHKLFMVEYVDNTRGASAKCYIQRLTRLFVDEYADENARYIASIKEGIREWASNLFKSNHDWKHDSSHFRNLASHVDNLVFALELEMVDRAMQMIERNRLAVGILNLLHIRGRWHDFENLAKSIIGDSRDVKTIEFRIMLGRHFAHQRDIDQAIEILDSALEISRDNKLKKFEAESLMRYGHALTLNGDLETAKEHLETSIKLSDSLHDRSIVASANGYLADILLQSGRYHEVTSLLSYPEVDWERASAFYSCMLGDAHQALGHISKGIEYYTGAQIVSQTWDDYRLGSLAQMGLAECDQGMLYAQKAKKVFRTCQMKRELQRVESFFIRIESIAKNPPKIFLVGPPASGKTTAMGVIEKQLGQIEMHPRLLSIHDIHIELSANPMYRDRYKRDQNDMLLIHEREKQIPLAMKSLSEKCESCRNDSGFVVEFAHESMIDAIKLFSDELMHASLVIFITAPVDTRLTRNEARGHLKTPPDIVESYSDTVSDKFAYKIRKCNARLVRVDSDCTIDVFKERIQTTIRNSIVNYLSVVPVR